MPIWVLPEVISAPANDPSSRSRRWPGGRGADVLGCRCPHGRTGIVASDPIWSPGRAAALVNSVEAHEVNLLIGTQLVTKGYHFPDLTLVGVVDADLGLAGGDLRASERTFQQIQQVAGRAGRGEKPGHVLLQTHQPEAAVIAALVSGAAEGFYAAETESQIGRPSCRERVCQYV